MPQNVDCKEQLEAYPHLTLVRIHMAALLISFYDIPNSVRCIAINLG